MSKAALFDAAERIFWTAVTAFFGVLAASPVFDNLGIGWQDALKLAGFAALASVIKQVLAIAATQNGTPQLGVTTYENSPDSAVVGPAGGGQ
jgi:hypothetical protein